MRLCIYNTKKGKGKKIDRNAEKKVIKFEKLSEMLESFTFCTVIPLVFLTNIQEGTKNKATISEFH